MACKHEYIFLKYHWNLNISEILQWVLNMNNILELLLKYHFHTPVMSSILLRLKYWTAKGASHHQSNVISLGYPVDEFSFKEMRTWVGPRLHLIVFVFGVNQEK